MTKENNKENNKDAKTIQDNTHQLSTQEEVLYNTTELGRILNDLESVEQKIQKNANDAIEELKAENLILRKLPVRLEEKLHEIIPDIAEALQKQVFESNFDKIKKTNKAIDDMMQQFDKKIAASLVEADRQISQSLAKVKRLTNNMVEYEAGSFKKKLIICAAAFAMLVASCCISSYIVYKKFPGRIQMRHDGPMHVENSNVMLHYPTIGKIDGTNNKKIGK